MIIIDNSQNISTTMIYGAYLADSMNLTNMQTNEDFNIPLFDTSPESRFGMFHFIYDESIPLNSGEVIEGTVHFNFVPGKYIYNINDLSGILYFKELKNNVIIYGQTNESTIYKG